MKEFFLSSYRKMHSVKYLALMAVFVALKTATSGIFIPVAENLRISLSFLFMSVAGAILGPVAGMITGAAMVLIWHNLIKPLGGVFGIYELMPAFLCSCLAIVIVSLLSKEPEQAVLDEFDHYMDSSSEERSLDAVLEGDIPLQ